MPKARLDRLLVDRELAADLKEAAALILAGKVFSGAERLDKAGLSLDPETPLSVKTPGHPYVSRGGLKLEAALRQWKLEVRGLACLDLGSSTGGFTDCLLKAGAARVTSVDSGTNQLDYRLRRDSRVRVMENTNARTLDCAAAGGPFDFASADLSFISLEKVFPALKRCLKPGATWVALVKPQFEAAPSEVPSGGVIQDAGLREALLERVRARAGAEGLGPEAAMECPIHGRDGNIEFLLMGHRA